MTLRTVLVTGSNGFVGSCLVPRLLKAGYYVKALDWQLYGPSTLQAHPNLVEIRGDIRDWSLLRNTLVGCDAVIHLACISNDPGYDLNPELGKSINYDAFGPLVDVACDSGVKRFIYASSSSVYGVKSEARVVEELKLEPLTDYSKYKALCEDVLLARRAPGFETLILRPATISGYSPRFRLDVVVNTLTLQALAERRIRLFGGHQSRANLYMGDMTRAYQLALEWPSDLIDGQVFNVGAQNFMLFKLAESIRSVIGEDVEIVTEPTNDPRSYSLCSDRIRNVLGFVPIGTLYDAIMELRAAYMRGDIVNPMTNDSYYNVKTLKKAGLK